MKNSLKALRKGFESSSDLTKEFAQFFNTFRKEFGKELEGIGATNISFNMGHFYISGFFDIGKQAYYFSLSDVRDFREGNGMWGCLLYRTATGHRDYRGGSNCYTPVKIGMGAELGASLKIPLL